MKLYLQLNSARVQLRTLTPADVPLVMEWANDHEVVKNFSFFQQTVNDQRVLDYIEQKYQSADDLLLAIFTANGDYIGNVGLHEIDRVNDTARLGIIIGKKSYWHQGYAQATIKLLLDWAFTAGAIHKIYLNAFITNQRAIELYQQLGFQREGVLRAEYKLAGKYIDLVRMGLLAEDHQANVNTDPAATIGEIN